VPHPAAPFGSLPHSSEGFGTPPQNAEPFGTIPNPAEELRTVPHSAEPFRDTRPEAQSRERFTLTVREVVRLFEAAGVARSERSVVNWCQRNRQGLARLEAYFDPNERRYYVTRQSVDTVIAEEQARAVRLNSAPQPQPAEPNGKVPDATEDRRTVRQDAEPDPDRDREFFDLKVTNRAKDLMIERLTQEREQLLEKVVHSSHRVGQLETRLQQLEAPHSEQNP
jgi:hypothetical protein